MTSVNQCNFIGNIGKIETRFLSNGDAVTNFSLACNDSYKDKNGEKVEKTEWVSCVTYRKLAEIMKKYCKVGQQIYVSGKLETREYTDKEGIKRYQSQIIANDMKMLGGKPGGGSDSGGREHSSQKSSQRDRPQTNTGFEDMDDDLIPF